MQFNECLRLETYMFPSREQLFQNQGQTLHGQMSVFPQGFGSGPVFVIFDLVNPKIVV